jgi:hypothetical protein
MSNTEEIDEFELSVDTVTSIIKMPDKFHFDKIKKIFYEITPFGVKTVEHLPVLKFLNKLNVKFGSQENFLDMIYDLTEFRLIDPHFYVDIYNMITNKTAGETITNNFNDIRRKYASGNPNIVKEIYDLATEASGMKIEPPMKIDEIPTIKGATLVNPI